MKRIFHLCLLVVMLLSACDKKEEIAPGEKPDERLNKTLTDYKNQLVGAENGWKAVLYPDGGAAYSFYIKFNANDRLSMLSDMNASSAATALESTYRLKAMQRPALLFDTYNYMHILADPDPSKSNGEVGAGKYSDFEFSFESVTPEAITLTGNLQGSRLILTKATKDEADNFIKRIAEKVKTFESINNFATYFKKLVIGNSSYDISVDTNLRQITFTYFEGTTAKTFTTDYYYTETGITFLTPFAVGGLNITGLNAIQYNATNRNISFTVNNVAGNIQESARPTRIDVEAARSFFNATGDDYLVAESGFTVNGVPDAYKVSSITNFYFVAFWPKYGTSNGQSYDIFGVVTQNPTSGQLTLFGPAAASRLTTDGRIVYTLLGTVGTQPAGVEAIMTPTIALWTNTQGFYVVTTQYGVDLVSASDGKSWINLYR
ncbi:hypothetical protein AAE02nite_09720 [Adhaeribacter aerolatus]|uniref:DUF4302 domain-containing protein n=1 Tax=Adhaeribacter aerolatus TaxID=670289 RepID=A0A512AUC4_9BACT|nr:DUF4302 domain-containing protein [Adhaeribacter aerolatus]GEO03308.1 hypothetical protein AAE02nite_09720 [Adhaeribacter aerolatus]